MNKSAIVIGVDKTGDLPVLNAAAEGAKCFGKWAASQGFEVTTITDEQGKSVTLDAIKQAIHGAVKKRVFGQLIVYFSGHGVLRGPDYELWLLSGAPDDPNEAVNVTGSIQLARNAGIPHIIIISDACRSKPDTMRLSQISGGVIFPNENPKTSRPEVDVFYATLPGNPALEVPAKDAVSRYEGIFTAQLLDGLKGNVPGVIETWQSPVVPPMVVPSWTLKAYLEKEVTEAASAVDIRLQQNPDIRVESHKPKYLADVSAASPAPEPPPVAPGAPFTRGAGRSFKRSPEAGNNLYRDIDMSANSHFEVRRTGNETEFQSAINRLISAKGRDSFETRTGFTVIGAEVVQAVMKGRPCDVFRENEVVNIRVHENDVMPAGTSLLIQLKDGNGMVLAVLPGYIGTVVVEDNRVMNVNYTPSRYTDRYQGYENSADDIDKRRALVAVAARNGSFRVQRDKANQYADYWRMMKSFDPTLGLYASYAYAQIGLIKEVESVYRYMSKESIPVLFDVALLADKLPGRSITNKKHAVAPFCPLLTQGWAMLGPYEEFMPKVVVKAGKYLLPGLWTTFRPEGVNIIKTAIEMEEIG